MDKIRFLIGKILAAIFAGIGIAFVVGLAALKMLPTVLVVVVAGVLAALVAAVLLLTWTGRGKVKMIIGIALAIIMIAALIVGTVYVYKTLSALNEISSTDTETIHVGIYIRSDSEDIEGENAAEYCYGVLRELDRTSTNKALEKMAQTFGTKPAYREYDRLPELLEALFDKQVDAIVLNQAYLELLQEMNGYEDISTRLHELFLQQIEVDMGENQLPQNGDENADPLSPFVLYISGIDAYGSVSVRSRSDVNILAVVNPRTRQVVLVSTPRDYYVPLSISNGIPDKLTHAGIYGVNVSIETLEMLYDIEIDYYFRVNFSGFTKLIDALGGITVYSQYSFKREDYTYQKGLNTMDGKKALAFCRERYSFSSGDRQRGKNQMAVIQAVIDKALSPALLKNYTQVLDAATGAFETSMPMEIIGAITAEQLKEGGKWNVTTCSADGTGDNQTPYSLDFSTYVMHPNYETVEHAKTQIQKVLNGEIVTPE